MPKDEETKERKRMVVEEVPSQKAEPSPVTPVAEIKEKIEEPQDLQEELTKEIEKVDVETPPVASSKSSPTAFWIILPGFLLLGALLGGIFFYQKGVNSENTQAGKPTIAPTVSASSSPTPSPKADLTKYSVSVQNGSGIAGEAGKVKQILEDAGFKVGSAGNAASYDYTKTLIKAKEDVDEAFLSVLEETLGKTYVLDKNEVLPDSSKDSVIVIVGSGKK